MEIKVADVAELVDARDLKFVAPFEIHRIFCITCPETKTKIDAKDQICITTGSPLSQPSR